MSPFPPLGERIRVGLLWLCCALSLVYLAVPILVPIPLSFSSGTFFTFPLPGVLSGAAFAFVTSFDEVVVAQANADQRSLPLEMFTGLREQISPAIIAAATMMMGLSILLLLVANLLSRRSRRMAGQSEE